MYSLDEGDKGHETPDEVIERLKLLIHVLNAELACLKSENSRLVGEAAGAKAAYETLRSFQLAEIRQSKFKRLLNVVFS